MSSFRALFFIAPVLVASACRGAADDAPAPSPPHAPRAKESAAPLEVTNAAPSVAPLEVPSTAPLTVGAASAALRAAGPCPEGMTLIPGGDYRPLKRRGRAHVEAYCLDVREVTVADYKACVREGKCSPECLRLGQCSAVPTRAEWGDPEENADVSRYCNGDREDRQNHPANCVSWEESRKYCEAYKKRLPSPDEWEWAARGAVPKAEYPWGNTYIDLQPCWSPKGRRYDGTCEVMSHPEDKSPQGVFDLAGNVAEWIEPPKGQPIMVFGASWYAMDDGYLRGALGGVEMPSTRNETVGFRCARSLSQGGPAH